MTLERNHLGFGFHPLKWREMQVRFDGGAITSDGSGLVLRKIVIIVDCGSCDDSLDAARHFGARAPQ
jgi:hypothetical protein